MLSDLLAKYLFLAALYGFLLFAVVQVLRALNRAAALEKPKARAHSETVPAGPMLLLGDREIRLPTHGELVIGRAEDCGLLLHDPFVSQRHAGILCEGGRCSIRDLGSTNGTRLNGQPVEQAALHDGDHIEMGSTTMVFRLGG